MLFLSHRIPFPPNKGDKIRSWNFLSHLARRYRVHVGCFVDDPHDWRYTAEIEAICGETCFRPLNRHVAMLRSARGLLSGDPLTRAYYRDATLMRWTRRLFATHPVSRVFVFSSSMAQYLPGGLPESCRTVLDLVDVDSDKWRQYAAKKPWPASWIYAREARTLLAYERREAARADATLFVSEDEASLFRQCAPEVAGRVVGVNNGVDSVYFDPAETHDSPYTAEEDPIVFTGAMDYWANVDAVVWFVREVFPGIRRAKPSARFWIVGANPAPEVSALASEEGVVVAGRVPDIRPYLAHARLAVAPLRVARGIQNKVLEAMAMARPVVATPQAMEGIAAEQGAHVAIAEAAEDFRAAVLACLDAGDAGDAAAMGVRARQCVETNYGWQSSFDRIDAVLERLSP